MAPTKKRLGSLPANAPLDSGKCMTCRTLMSWPAASDDALIKCPVCVTLNRATTLKERTRSAQHDAKERPSGEAQGPVETINIDHTRWLIDDCFHRHAIARFCSSPSGVGNHEHEMTTLFKAAREYLARCFSSVEAVSSSFSSCHSDPLPDSPMIDWDQVSEWYSLIVYPAERWPGICAEISQRQDYRCPTDEELQTAERDVLNAQGQLQDRLIKVTTNLLCKPGGRFSEVEELKFFLIILENPLIHPDHRNVHEKSIAEPSLSGPLAGRHSGVIKRIIGLINNVPPHLHHQLVLWWSKHDHRHFSRTKDLVSGFLSYRLLRQEASRRDLDPRSMPGLASEMQFRHSDMELEDGIFYLAKNQWSRGYLRETSYHGDWQIRAACAVLGLLFDANKKAGFMAKSDFCNSLADYVEVHSEFHQWGQGKSFSLCQYPFLLSMWAKTQILKHSVSRQVEDAAVGAIFSATSTSMFLTLDVKRECLADESLTEIGAAMHEGAIGSKRGLRIKFRGEEGIDDGGPRKEWFSLLIKEVFNPENGLFLYDEDSHYCYFNPYSLDDTDTIFNIGAVLGLAITNAVVLDVPLPSFLFRKVVSEAPKWCQGNYFTGVGEPMEYTLDDLAEYHPQLAKGLRHLLEYDGDFEETFSLDFAIDVQKYDTRVRIPLCEGGESKPVTSSNRSEYVRLYIQYLLSTSVKRQFNAFAEGFFTACPARAPPLLRADELELLIRGSDEPLNVSALRSSAEYEDWDSPLPDGQEPLVGWFWDSFEAAAPSDQRKLLSFITGSDRLPAVGAAVAPLRISYLGLGSDRYPIARTCFNILSLYRYESREQLESKLWGAVYGSEGFGLA